MLKIESSTKLKGIVAHQKEPTFSSLFVLELLSLFSFFVGRFRFCQLKLANFGLAFFGSSNVGKIQGQVSQMMST